MNLPTHPKLVGPIQNGFDPLPTRSSRWKSEGSLPAAAACHGPGPNSGGGAGGGNPPRTDDFQARSDGLRKAEPRTWRLRFFGGMLPRDVRTEPLVGQLMDGFSVLKPLKVGLF